MGRGNSGRISSTNSQTGSQRMSGGGNAGSGSVPNSNAGFVVDGVRYYASRRDAIDNARPGETEIAMVASGSGFAFYYLPMRPEDYQRWLRGGVSMRQILNR